MTWLPPGRPPASLTQHTTPTRTPTTNTLVRPRLVTPCLSGPACLPGPAAAEVLQGPARHKTTHRFTSSRRGLRSRLLSSSEPSRSSHLHEACPRSYFCRGHKCLSLNS
ncbi:hypothetical protein Pmani_038070 [Petrolisthes manimaculis]|uniref:Uncharacterized protein n=1 Tax=Petrolisthes manimaculis TaxID=1843537 RepID=A0AAE1TKK9_9EUCA|nr:hypothetical protein Pmani_038070 [Petrolisthes manimaculis]